MNINAEIKSKLESTPGLHIDSQYEYLNVYRHGNWLFRLRRVDSDGVYRDKFGSIVTMGALNKLLAETK